jgi:hypothetical protein
VKRSLRQGDGAAALVRLLTVAFVGLSVLAGVLVVVGLATEEIRCFAAGVLGLPLAWVIREWLRQLVREARAANGAARSAGVSDPAGAPPLDALVDLLREWDALERRRGLPDFDPWALLSLRREIQRRIEESPALSRLMHG